MKDIKWGNKELPGLSFDELNKLSVRAMMNREKIRNAYESMTVEERKAAAKKAHDKVDWKAVNGAKDNFAIQAHRAQKVFAWKADTHEFVGEYRSMTEAGRQLNVSQGNIGSALDNGKVRKGYKFTTKKQI